MTVTDPDVTHCAQCQSTSGTLMPSGLWLCFDCRAETDPTVASAPGPSPDPAHPGPTSGGGPAPLAHITHVDVTVQWVESGAVEVRRSTYETREPHTEQAALEAGAADVAHDLEQGTADEFRTSTPRVAWSSQPFPPAPSDGDDDDEAGPAVFVRPVADEDASQFLNDLEGHHVELADGRTAMVRGFPDDDHVTVELPNGRKTTVDLDDVVRDITGDEAAAAVVELDDEAAAALGGAVLEMAALIVEAGAGMVEGEGPDAVLLMAPEGWLPLAIDDLGLLEQGSATAVAALVRAFDLPRATVRELIESMRASARQAEPEQETPEHDQHQPGSTEPADDAGTDPGTDDLPGSGHGEDQGE